MRRLGAAAVLAGLLAAGCATPPKSAARGEIVAAEAAWTEAVRTNDRAALERLLAPEFALMGAGAGRATPRDEWLANLAAMQIRSYAVRVTDVRVDGDTATADAEGQWAVARNGRVMNDAFVLKDTWVRRDGQWQVVRRVRLNPPPAAAGRPSRERPG
jgi:ketosteroid isomerase-like protein